MVEKAYCFGDDAAGKKQCEERFDKREEPLAPLGNAHEEKEKPDAEEVREDACEKYYCGIKRRRAVCESEEPLGEGKVEMSH